MSKAVLVLIAFFKKYKQELFWICSNISAPLTVPKPNVIKILWSKNKKYKKMTINIIRLLLPRRFKQKQNKYVG